MISALLLLLNLAPTISPRSILSFPLPLASFPLTPRPLLHCPSRIIDEFVLGPIDLLRFDQSGFGDRRCGSGFGRTVGLGGPARSGGSGLRGRGLRGWWLSVR